MFAQRLFPSFDFNTIYPNIFENGTISKLLSVISRNASSKTILLPILHKGKFTIAHTIYSSISIDLLDKRLLLHNQYNKAVCKSQRSLTSREGVLTVVLFRSWYWTEKGVIPIHPTDFIILGEGGDSRVFWSSLAAWPQQGRILNVTVSFILHLNSRSRTPTIPIQRVVSYSAHVTFALALMFKSKPTTMSDKIVMNTYTVQGKEAADARDGRQNLAQYKMHLGKIGEKAAIRCSNDVSRPCKNRHRD